MTRSRSATSPTHFPFSSTLEHDVEFATMAQRLAAIHKPDVTLRGQAEKDVLKAESNEEPTKTDKQRNTPYTDQDRGNPTGRPATRGVTQNDTIYVDNETVHTTATTKNKPVPSPRARHDTIHVCKETVHNIITTPNTTNVPPPQTQAIEIPRHGDQPVQSRAHTRLLTAENGLKVMNLNKIPESKAGEVQGVKEGVNGRFKNEINGAVTDEVKDISTISPEELKALSSPSNPHVKIAIQDLSLPASERKRTVIFESYPLPLLEFISPRVRGILAERASRLKKQQGSETPTKDPANTTNNNCEDDNDSISPPRSFQIGIAEADSGSPAFVPVTATAAVPPPYGITLQSHSPTALSLLLSFALASSTHVSPHNPTAAALLSIPLNQCAFYKYARIVEEARYLGFSWVESKLLRRMRRVGEGQVHSLDMERILNTTDPLCHGTLAGSARGVDDVIAGGKAEGKSEGENRTQGQGTTLTDVRAGEGKGKGRGAWFRAMAVRSVATALWEGRLRYKWKYEVLREQYPDFDNEVSEAMGALDEEYWEGYGEFEREVGGGYGYGSDQRQGYGDGYDHGYRTAGWMHGYGNGYLNRQGHVGGFGRGQAYKSGYGARNGYGGGV